MGTNDVDKIQHRSFDLSKIILGFTGSIGSGCTFISEGLQSVSNGKYKYFKLSSVIEDELKKEGIQKPTIAQKQDKGNDLRKEHRGSILASHLIDYLECNPRILESVECIIFDGIKNIKEVQFLRQFPFFFLFSVQSDTEIRCQRCVPKCFDNPEDFYTADKRDELEEDVFGQQVKKCNYLSDVIILNNKQIPRADKTAQNELFRRIHSKYVQLIENLRDGEISQTKQPSLNELCMTIAYSLSKMSSCIKRKVGAMIVENLTTQSEGEKNSHRITELPFIVSSGFNEVPLGSHKCIFHPKFQMCYRDHLQEEHAKGLKHCPECGEEIQFKLKCPQCEKSFTRFTKFCPECRKEIEDKFKCQNCGCEVFKKFLPGAKDSPGKLLDMCRALHAEEIALLKLASSGISKKNLTLFVTTQPCNLCANKIVTTGIRKVVFDAPYSMKESQDVLTDGGVEVERFEGIKSSAYFKLYQS